MYDNGIMGSRIVRKILMIVEGMSTSGAKDAAQNDKTSGSSVLILNVRDSYTHYVAHPELYVVKEMRGGLHWKN